jgi:hypothetical protein
VAQAAEPHQPDLWLYGLADDYKTAKGFLDQFYSFQHFLKSIEEKSEITPFPSPTFEAFLVAEASYVARCFLRHFALWGHKLNPNHSQMLEWLNRAA